MQSFIARRTQDQVTNKTRLKKVSSQTACDDMNVPTSGSCDGSSVPQTTAPKDGPCAAWDAGHYWVCRREFSLLCPVRGLHL